MTKLWRAIEESPLLMDVKDVWRERLGMEFEPLSRFLEPTNIVATRLPGRTPWSSFKVVVNDDSFVAFCESTGESRDVQAARFWSEPLVILDTGDIAQIARGWIT